MKFQFCKFGFWHEKDQPTQRNSVCYQTPVWTGIKRPHKMRRVRGAFAVRTLRGLAGKNWKNT
jgi:hypothetical protein